MYRRELEIVDIVGHPASVVERAYVTDRAALSQETARFD